MAKEILWQNYFSLQKRFKIGQPLKFTLGSKPVLPSKELQFLTEGLAVVYKSYNQEHNVQEGKNHYILHLQVSEKLTTGLPTLYKFLHKFFPQDTEPIHPE